MADVFVSYKAEDRRRVKPLVDALEADGYSVWWDEQIGGGATWRRAIEAELNSAKCVIVAWSKRSVGEEGTFVQDEATRAQQRHVYVPVLIDKVHLPLGFGETQALPLSGWKGDRTDTRYEAVLAAVQRITGGASGGATAKAPSRKQPHVDRRAVLAGGAVATVAVLGAGGWALLKSSSASAASDSIAVLPFANLSGDPNQAYFSDGIAEEIRSSLARLAGLKVVGRTSSEAVRNDDAESAAKKLEVANILTGSVRQSPSTIRISAELIDGRTGLDRWSQDYDRSPGDAIKIQTDIAQNVASALSAALGEAAKAAVTVGGTDNPNAQKLLIQAIALENGPNSKEAVERAIDLLGSAIRLDPNYADAYARKASLLVRWGNNYGTTPSSVARSRAEALGLAQNALRIAPDLAQAHRALFSVYGSNLQMAPAVAELTRARALAPGDADILAIYGRYLSRIRRFDEGLQSIDKAIASDPLNGSAYEFRTATLFYARRYRDALSFARRVEAKSPELAPDPVLVGDTLVALGNFSDAQAQYSKAAPDYWGRVTGEALVAALQGNRPESLQKLARLRQLYGDAASTQLGEIYAQLGDHEAALAALERAYEVKDAGLTTMLVDPWLDPIRNEPRFEAIVRKMNFPA
jgi:serine/threonine-protein kinase